MMKSLCSTALVNNALHRVCLKALLACPCLLGELSKGIAIRSCSACFSLVRSSQLGSACVLITRSSELGFACRACTSNCICNSNSRHGMNSNGGV